MKVTHMAIASEGEGNPSRDHYSWDEKCYRLKKYSQHFSLKLSWQAFTDSHFGLLLSLLFYQSLTIYHISNCEIFYVFKNFLLSKNIGVAAQFINGEFQIPEKEGDWLRWQLIWMLVVGTWDCGWRVGWRVLGPIFGPDTSIEYEWASLPQPKWNEL